jgi:hypothetical protein
MKTLTILFIVLLSFTMESIGQKRKTPPNALYLAYQPADHGLGIRGDYHINHWAGVYGSGSYGQWRMYKRSGLGQHIKLTLGALIPYRDDRGNQHDFTLGLNYHWVSGQIVGSEIYKDDPIFHNPWSFEIGFTIKLPRIALGIRTDMLRWEPCIDVGIPLHTRKRFR